MSRPFTSNQSKTVFPFTVAIHRCDLMAWKQFTSLNDSSKVTVGWTFSQYKTVGTWKFMSGASFCCRFQVSHAPESAHLAIQGLGGLRFPGTIDFPLMMPVLLRVVFKERSFRVQRDSAERFHVVFQGCFTCASACCSLDLTHTVERS